MEHTPGLETSPPGSDTFDVARGAGTPAALEAAVQQPLIDASIVDRAVIEQRAIAMLGDDGNASLSEIFPQAGVPRCARPAARRARRTTVRLIDDHLELSPPEALDESPAAVRLLAELDRLAPRIDIPDLLAEVEQWTRFTGKLTHAAGATPRMADLHQHLHPALLTSGLNLGPALGEYGRIVRTNFLLVYCADPAERARIADQLNKGETLHALRRHLVIGSRADPSRRRRPRRHALCLQILVNALQVWNARYMTASIDHLHATRPDIVADQTALARVAPVAHAHVNSLGRYDLHRQPPPAGHLRPLRRADDHDEPGVLTPPLGVSGDKH
jgi:hypothetical protein